MKKFLKISILSLALATLTVSCKKDTVATDPEPAPAPVPTPTTVPTPTGTTGSVKIVLNNMVDNLQLELNKEFMNPAGESYKLTKFNYYISNITLVKTDNSVINIKNFFKIIQQDADSSKTITLTGINNGSYKSVRLMLGVDSARNCSGVQSGGLDVAYAADMYWNWSQGYIFLKLEGTSPSSTLQSNYVEYHIGGYGGKNKTQRNFDLGFNGSTLNINSATTPTVNLNVNVNEIFQNPVIVKFANLPSSVSSNATAKMLADNYSDMISFGSIKNQ